MFTADTTGGPRIVRSVMRFGLSFLLFGGELSCEILGVFNRFLINEHDLLGIGDTNLFKQILLMFCVCLHFLLAGQVGRRSSGRWVLGVGFVQWE